MALRVRRVERAASPRVIRFFAPELPAEALQPRDWRPVSLLAVALEQSDRYSDALAAHQKALALEPDNSVSVEEAYVQTTSLGQGLSLKAGRFFSGIGYLNPQHSHTWDFVDNPLVYQAMLGTQYSDDGLQLSWLAPTDQYIEVNAEVAGNVQLINEDPYGKGWLVKVRPDDPSEISALLDHEAYEKKLASEPH